MSDKKRVGFRLSKKSHSKKNETKQKSNENVYFKKIIKFLII